MKRSQCEISTTTYMRSADLGPSVCDVTLKAATRQVGERGPEFFPTVTIVQEDGQRGEQIGE